MSIQNKGNRRLSMASFAGLFLLLLFLCCTAFVRTMKKTEDIPRQEFISLQEKEIILADFAELSKALCRFDQTKEDKDGADARNKKIRLYQKLFPTDDTTAVYKDVSHFMKMADDYYELIEQTGKASDDQMKQYNQELSMLRKENEALQNEKNKMEMTVLTKEKEMAAMLVDLKSAKAANSAKSSGGGGSAPAVSTTTKDCTPEVNAYKSDMKLSIAMLKEDIQKISTGVDKISTNFVGGKKKVEKEKRNIKASISQLEGKVRGLLER